MRVIRIAAFLATLVPMAAGAPSALAHHGFGTFVMDEDIELTGTVTDLAFVNPHSWLYLDVVQDGGEVVAFRCEMRSANTLRRSGWTPDLFPVGEEVTITGSPDRDDPYSCYVSTVIFRRRQQPRPLWSDNPAGAGPWTVSGRSGSPTANRTFQATGRPSSA